MSEEADSKVGKDGVASGGAIQEQVAGLDKEQTNAQLAGATDGGMGSTTGAEKQINVGETDPNNAPTGTRLTPTGEIKDTTAAQPAKVDDPYSPGPRHVDPTSGDAPTPVDVQNHGGSGDQTRSDYSMGVPKQAPGESDQDYAGRVAKGQSGAAPAQYAGESDRAYELRMKTLEDAKKRASMSAEERMKDAGTHPDDLPESASPAQKEMASKLLSYERIKDMTREIVTEMEDNLGQGIGVGRAIADLDTLLGHLREHIG